MSESSAPCPCPQGHGDTVKLLSTVAVGGRAGSQAPGPQGGGGCCGGACGCGGTVDYLVDAVFNYPTLAESYKVAALDATNKMREVERFST